MPPSIIQFPGETREPIWVAASEAVDSSGHARPDTMGTWGAKLLQAQLDLSDTDGCLRFTPSYDEPASPPRRLTVDDAISDSRTVILARVTNQAFGFFGAAVPGQLIQVEIERVFGPPLPRQPYYFFIPIGDFTVGHRLICQSDSTYPHAPVIGMEVFLFIAGAPQGQNHDLLYTYGPGDIALVERDGSLTLAPQYTRDPKDQTRAAQLFSSKATLLARIQEIREKGAPR